MAWWECLDDVKEQLEDILNSLKTLHEEMEESRVDGEAFDLLIGRRPMLRRRKSANEIQPRYSEEYQLIRH
jgi:hypothetical protein